MKRQENFLDYIPAVSDKLTFSVENDIVTLDITHKGIFPWIAQKLFHRPKISHIKLDKYGSFVWLRIDGKNTVYDIAEAMKTHFGKDAEPLYDRLIKYLKILKNNNFIIYRKEV